MRVLIGLVLTIVAWGQSSFPPASGGGGAPPAGSGSEVNARLNGTTFQAVASSATVNTQIAAPPTPVLAVAGMVGETAVGYIMVVTNAVGSSSASLPAILLTAPNTPGGGTGVNITYPTIASSTCQIYRLKSWVGTGSGLIGSAHACDGSTVLDNGLIAPAPDSNAVSFPFLGFPSYNSSAGARLPSVSSDHVEPLIAAALPATIVLPGNYYYLTELNSHSLGIGSDGFPVTVSVAVDTVTVNVVHCDSLMCAAPTTTTLGTIVAGSAPSLVIAPDGFPRILYTTTGSGAATVHLVICADNSCSMNTNTAVATTTFSGNSGVALAVTSANIVHFIYQNDTSGLQLYLGLCNNTTTCNAPTLTSITTFGASRMGPLAVVMGNDNFARVGYSMQDVVGGLHLLQCTNASCSTNVDTTVVTPINSDGFMDIALGGDGLVRLVYEAGQSVEVYVRCTNAPCSTANFRTIAGNDAAGPSMQIGADGLARILINHGYGVGLSYVICQDLNCDSFQFVDLLSAGSSVYSLAASPDKTQFYGKWFDSSFTNINIQALPDQQVRNMSRAGSLARPYSNVVTNHLVVVDRNGISLEVGGPSGSGIWFPRPIQSMSINQLTSYSGGDLTPAASMTFDASKGSYFPLSADDYGALNVSVTTTTLTGLSYGQTLLFKVCEDSLGGRTFAWPSNVSGADPILTTALACTLQWFVSFDGSTATAVGRASYIGTGAAAQALATLGAGSAPLKGTTGSIGGGLLTAGTCATGTATVTGATTSMTTNLPQPAAYPGDGFEFFSYVSAADTVTVKVCAIVALTPTATTYNVAVTP